jgi:hypothetical protein
VPSTVSPPSKTTAGGTSIAPIRPKPATISADHAIEVPTPTAAIAPARTSAAGGLSRW